MPKLARTESLANEIVTEDVDDSIKASTFTIPWAQVIEVLVKVLITATPYLLASAGITLLAATPGVKAQAYVTKRYRKKLGLFNLLLIWRVRHHLETQAKANNLVLTTVQANDLSIRLLNKVMSMPVDRLDGVVGENLS